MKHLLSLLLASSLLTIAGCGSEPEERTELNDYKERQLEKAKAVEEKMNKRVDDINKQLEKSSQSKDDDTE